MAKDRTEHQEYLATDTALIKALEARFASYAKRQHHLLIDLTTVRNHLRDAADKAVELSESEIGQWRNVKIVEATTLNRCLSIIDQALSLHKEPPTP